VLPDHLRREIHEGLLANDVVGFHTHRWKRNFLHSCEEILGADVDMTTSTVNYDGRRTLVSSHPIGVDPAEFDELKDSDGVLEQERLIVARRPEHLVVRVDRTDPSKNIVRGFRAFALYLDMHPDMQGRVTMLALLDPSRQDVPEYSEYLAAVQREARAVNDRFQRDGWLPIDLAARGQLRAIGRGVQAVRRAPRQRGLRRAQPRLKGGAAPERPRRRAHPLREHGAHEELAEWALTVNPFDVYGQAESIHLALTMPPDERRARLEATRVHVRRNDLAAWIAAQLGDLDRVSERVSA